MAMASTGMAHGEELAAAGMGNSTQQGRARRAPARRMRTTTTILSILAATPAAMAQNCISLAGSSTCPAFNTSSISTDSTLVGFFPFLSFVSDTASFDDQMNRYISEGYVQQKYQQLLGCDNIDLTNTTNLYARFSTTVLCNAIVQNSRATCGLSAENSRPVCAETCAQFATSEAIIATDSSLCSNPSSDYQSQIRADFVNCGLPANALSGSCIDGADNEPTYCGFRNNTIGLCQYCAAGGQNSTDTCCYNSGAEQRCANVVLPTVTGLMTFSTAMPTATPTSSSPPSSSTSAAAAPAGSRGLSKGAIAGIVIGSVVALALLIGLIALLFICMRRRRGSQAGSVFNQPSPARKGQTGMAYNPVGATQTAPAGYEVLPGGRIARMSALEGHSGDSPPRGDLGVGAGAAGYAAGRRKHQDQSSSDEYSPESNSQRGGVLRPPPTGRRTGSLSSNSILGDGGDPHSPNSGSGEMSSPIGMNSQQSEQLPFFKDYYSQDEINTGDKVSTLWAYQPRAGDEFALERGDMLKVVGIWDDGWATGVLLEEKAEEWEARKLAQRDSGVSNTSGRREASPDASGEIKAFPLVCVCLPQYWRRTIEGDASTETGSSVTRPVA